MKYRNSYAGLDTYAADLIRHKARQLVGKAGFTEDDREDLEQELMIDLIQRMRHYNPSIAKKTTFMARIVERHIATILEARFAQCRDIRCSVFSLNSTFSNSDGEPEELSGFLSGEGSFKNHAHESRERIENDIRFEIERSLASLPNELRDLCNRLRTHNMAEIARELKIPRSTLYERLNVLRQSLRDLGLEEYL